MDHLNQEEITAYCACSLAPAEVLRISDHLMQCAACRTRAFGRVNAAAGAAAIRTNLSSEGALAHLTYDEIAAYADGHMNRQEAETVQAHARECANCAADLREIQGFKAELDAGQSKAARPNRMAAFWRAIHGWSGVGALAAAAACLLVVALAIRPRQATPTAKVEPPKQEERGGAPAAPAPAGPVIRDGSRAITLSADGSVAGLDGLPDRFRGAVEQALATRRVSAPAALAELAAKRSVLLGPSAPSARVDLLQPIGSMVETQRPVFRWRAVAGAEYQVGVYDSEFQQAAQSGWTRVPEWQSSTELRRGVRYFWQLTVRRDGSEFTAPEPPAPEARFAILDAASEGDLVRLRGTWSDSHLVMGVAYAQAGLLSEAQRELQAVADQNPDAATIAALLASVTPPAVNSVPRRSK